jgi:dienelactone hydrolase
MAQFFWMIKENPVKQSKIFLSVCLFLAFFLVSGCSQATQTAEPVTPTQPQMVEPAQLEQNAVQFVQQLAAGEFTAAAAGFDQTMQAAMPAAKLEQTWDQLLTQVGAFQQINGTRREEQSGYQIVYVTSQFEGMKLDVKVVYNAGGQIAGLFFQPSASVYLPPDYADEQSFIEVEVTVGSGEWALPGTLTLPKGDGPFPAVVLVHGSGPNDRDETMSDNKPLKDIAWGLASRGIAVLRYDKRTFVHKALLTVDILRSFTLNEETVEDALLAADLLRANPSIDAQRVFVLGHSLGGMALPRIGSRYASLAGLISLAGPTRPMEDVILDQVNYLYSLDGSLSDGEKINLAILQQQVELVKSPDLSVDTPLASLPLSTPAAYWLDLRDYHPADVAAGLTIPMLILQGGRDYQVTLADYQGWQTGLSGRADVTFKFYPDLNHLFFSGQGMARPEEYQAAGHVDQQVIEDIASWILHR